MQKMTQAIEMQNEYAMSADVENQYLSFVLANEEYAVDILRVQEIRGWEAVTALPNAPDYVRGVVNIRGTIVPIADLRLRFNMQPLDYGPMTVVIVLKVEDGDHERVMGIVVDGVSDTHEIPVENVKPAPDFGDRIELAFVKGLATVDENMLILLDIDKLLNSCDLGETG
jgi:purine-binding chemotaxis protein CheW